jgi:hypothetical protein
MFVQLAGGVIAVQLKPTALEEEAVAVRPTGAEEGMAAHELAEFVSALATVEGADAPAASTASTAK